MKDLITIIMITVALVMMIIGCNSCYTERTAQRQVDKAHHRYPLVPATFCSERYPPTDSISIVKEYIPGEDLVFTDTLVEFQTLRDTAVVTKYITRTVRTTDTLRYTRYVQQENKAGLIVKDAVIKKCSEENALLRQSNDSKTCWLWILGGILGMYLLYRLVRLYLAGRKLFV
jgi:hypothetical protein